MEFNEAYLKLFKDAFSRLKRAIKLKVHAMRLCSRGTDQSYDLSIGDASEFNMDDAPQNITSKLSLTNKEKLEIKEEELKYELKAVRLD